MPSRIATIATRGLALLAVLTVSGCGVLVVRGEGRMDPDAWRPAPQSRLTIEGSDGDKIDKIVANAIDDLHTFWSAEMPDLYGVEAPELSGGVWSVDPDEDPKKMPPCMDSVEEVEENAFFCGGYDVIVYDRDNLEMILKEYGELDVIAGWMAHEYGHALQNVMPNPTDRSIVFETQADCFAGAWTKWLAEGKAPHFQFDPDELDGMIADFVLLAGDQPGSDPDDDRAHGSAYDRARAVIEGYESGATACRDNFQDDRPFVSAAFTPSNDGDDGAGNVDLATAIDSGSTELSSFLGTVLPPETGEDFTAPTVEDVPDSGGNGSASECEVPDDTDDVFTYCADSNTIAGDEAELSDAHDQLGDFAVITLLGLEYGEAALDQAGVTAQGEKALTASTCLTGAFAGTLLAAQPAVLSPGDLDEALDVLLGDAGSADPYLAAQKTSAWERISAFTDGVTSGLAACELPN